MKKKKKTTCDSVKSNDFLCKFDQISVVSTLKLVPELEGTVEESGSQPVWIKSLQGRHEGITGKEQTLVKTWQEEHKSANQSNIGCFNLPQA